VLPNLYIPVLSILTLSVGKATTAAFL